MHLVVGLGNPERRYERTRHNVGFVVIDELASRLGVSVDRKEFGAHVVRAMAGGVPAVLAKPQSWMNLSGQPVASLRGFYKVELPRILVIHDDLELPFGQVSLRMGGGHAGHNGLRDIQKLLGDNAFARLRIGIGRPPAGWDVADYVLAKWTESESAALDTHVSTACDAVLQFLQDGLVEARPAVRPQASKKGGAAKSELPNSSYPGGTRRSGTSQSESRMRTLAAHSASRTSRTVHLGLRGWLDALCLPAFAGVTA